MRIDGGRSWLIAGAAVALLIAAATAPAALSPASADAERARAAVEPPEIRSGDEDHLDGDEPPPAAPMVDLPAGRNELTVGSPWAGLWGPEIEPLAAYEPQRLCLPGARPAVAAFAALLERAYPQGDSLGIARACSVGARSEHKEGRAYDWGVDVTVPVERAAAEELVAWLLATDEHGNDFAMARRLGVMYVIWDGHIWSSQSTSDGWRVYRGPSPHTDHVHLSFNWAGATGSTSFWDVAGIGPWLFDDVVLDHLPPTLHLGADRYRAELGPRPGDLTTWGRPSAEPDPAGGDDAEPGTATPTSAPPPVPDAPAEPDAIGELPATPPAGGGGSTGVPLVDDVADAVDLPTPPVTVPTLPGVTVPTTPPVVEDLVEDPVGTVGEVVEDPVGTVGDVTEGVVGGVLGD